MSWLDLTKHQTRHCITCNRLIKKQGTYCNACYALRERLTRRAKGLCTHCNQPAVSQRTLCEKHQRLGALSARRKRAEHKANGLCMSCAEPAVSHRTLCARHLRINALYAKITAQFYVERGICPSCKKQSVEKPFKYCKFCKLRYPFFQVPCDQLNYLGIAMDDYIGDPKNPGYTPNPMWESWEHRTTVKGANSGYWFSWW